MAGSGRGQNTVLADKELLDAVGSANLGNQLDHLGVPETTITTDDEEGTWKDVRVSYYCDHGMCFVCWSSPSAPSGMDSRMLVTKDSL